MTVEHDPIADNEKERAHAKAVAKLARGQELEDVRHVMSSASGRRFAYRLIERAGNDLTAFHGEETHKTAFALGGKEFGTFIKAEVNEACPKFYITMLQEHKRG